MLSLTPSQSLLKLGKFIPHVFFSDYTAIVQYTIHLYSNLTAVQYITHQYSEPTAVQYTNATCFDSDHTGDWMYSCITHLYSDNSADAQYTTHLYSNPTAVQYTIHLYSNPTAVQYITHLHSDPTAVQCTNPSLFKPHCCTVHKPVSIQTPLLYST